MNKTSFLELNKPSYEDLADINLLNQNLDRIDQEFKNINNTFYEQDDIKITVKPNSIASFDSKISTKINPTIKGKFMQNLIDTHKCIYRIDGSPMPINITNNSMLVKSYSSGFVGTGCYVGVVSGKEYTIKASSLSESSIYIYDAQDLNFENRMNKRVAYSSNVTNHNFKFIAPSSNYVFIVFNKIGTDTTGTIFKNPICVEGDYLNQDIEWFKGVKPSDINIKSVGENLYTCGDIIQARQGTDTSYKSIIQCIKVKPNTDYYLKAFGTNPISTSRFILVATNFSTEKMKAKDIVNKDYPQVVNHGSLNTGNNNYLTIISYKINQDNTMWKNVSITKSSKEPDKYIKPQKSAILIDDWLGDNDSYSNGLSTKFWRRIKLSEAWDGNYFSVTADIGNVYRFYINLKDNYSKHNQVNTAVKSYFSDYIYNAEYNKNIKHQYLFCDVGLDINQLLLFIPKAEIDSLSGNNLNEKFIKWMNINDDYIYYKKANSIAYKPFGSDDLVSAFGQTNIINNCNSNIDLTIQQNLCDANNKSSYISAPIKKRNIKINVSDWKNEGNIYTANIYDDDITDLKMVDISFNVGRDFESIKDISKHTQTFDGFVKIYSTKRIQKDLEVNLVIN